MIQVLGLEYQVINMFPELATTFLVISSFAPGSTVDFIPRGSWGPWKTDGKTCEEGAQTETSSRQCFLDDKVADLSYCDGSHKAGLSCGPPTFTIVRGDDVKDLSRWTWQVFIELDNGQDQCGGTLISSEWVLTAAHCFAGKVPTNILMGTTTKSGKDPTTVTAKVDRICCHKEFDGDSLQNDICLVKIIAVLNHVTVPVVLPDVGEEVSTGKSCWITGWGYDENDNLPDLLQEAVVNIIDKGKCKEWYKSDGTQVVNNTICAGHERGGADTCGGDSGGPLVCSGDKGYVLHGITSYGPIFCGSAKMPGIYTKVTDFLQWISDTMKNSCPKYAWGPWISTCSVSCGTGTEHSKRVCVDEQNNEVLLSNCTGSSQKYGPCNLSECAKYSWGPWEGTCSTTCGEGVKSETRACLDQANTTVSAENCEGDSQRTSACTLEECEEYSWSEWEATCSVTCGDGTMLKTRDCLNQNGVKVDNWRCDGEAIQQEACSLSPCIAPAGYYWGPWNVFCGVTCGVGTQTRIRNCMNAAGQVERNSNMCSPGRAFRLRRCRQSPCPQEYESFSWGGWTSWSSCQSTNSANSCIGYKYATRQCLENNEEVSPFLCGVPPFNQKQTTCSNKDCNNPWQF